MNDDSMHIAADSGIDRKLVVEGSEKTKGEQRRTGEQLASRNFSLLLKRR